MATGDETKDESSPRIPSQTPERAVGGLPEWIDIEQLAQVDVTSEDADHPIRHALVSRHEAGWRAAQPGKQSIRVRFHQPQNIRRIYLHFAEADAERHQEFVLRWAESASGPMEELVRQQWNFSPAGSTHEIEDYRPSPRQIEVLELEIVPDTSGGEALASLQQFHLA
jgi:hypothetical protein